VGGGRLSFATGAFLWQLPTTAATPAAPISFKNSLRLKTGDGFLSGLLAINSF